MENLCPQRGPDIHRREVHVPVKQVSEHEYSCDWWDGDNHHTVFGTHESIVNLHTIIARMANDRQEAEAEVERLQKLCHRSAKHLATSNRLSDLLKGSEASKLYVDLVAEVHLGEEG